MEHVKCATADFAEENVKKLLALFPEVEGEKGIVDLDKLRQVLSSKVVEGNVERYEFTWPGKRAAKAAAGQATTKTLRPCREESVGKDGTPGGFDSENLYIEGDNLEVLKLLQHNYAGKVKMIYIDPPYNTGHDFVYRDRFSLTDKELAEQGGSFDADGNRFEVNDSSEARYHSNWCSMMYPRLKLARQLLRDDGVMFMSIDDNEVVNARKLCDEVFGECNAIAQCVWEKMYTTKNDAGSFSECHEYVLIYARDYDSINIALLPRTAEMDARYVNTDNDPRGPWKPIPLSAKGERKNGRYPVVSPLTGREWYPDPDSHWLYRREDTEKMVADNRIYFGKDGNAKPNVKRFLTEVQQGTKVKTLWKYDEVGSNDSAKRELRALYDDKFIPFSFPKPTTLIDRMLTLIDDEDATVLDFFSGSGTTAHAVLSRNARDNGRRKFIMVQLPEVCAEDSEAAKVGYKNICEIGEERIRRAGKKIVEELKAKNDKEQAANPLGLDGASGIRPIPDIGFRVLKLDSSSLNDTSDTPANTTQAFANFARFKEGRTSEDLLFQILLESGIPLSDPIEKKTVGGNEVFFVSGTALVACLDEKAKMTNAFFTELAQLKPTLAFFRDDAFETDAARINLEQIFAQYSSNTTIKVI